jgi:hypothetical protein
MAELMTDNEILTRAVELIYMSKGIAERDLSDTATDASKIIEVVADGDGVRTVSAVLEIGLIDRFGVNAFDSVWDDAEFLFALAKRVA